MTSRPLLVAAFAFFIAAGAFAQATDDSLHGSGGQIELLGKNPDRWSGSLSISAARSQLPFTAGMTRAYSGSLGGTLIPDHLWFFGSVDRVQPLFAQTSVASAPVIRGFDMKTAAQIGDRQNLAAWFAAAPGVRIDPSTFMTLHYTGVVTPNSFFTATIQR